MYILFLISDPAEFVILVVVVILILLSPAIILTIIGLAVRKKNENSAKTLFIIAAVYVLVGAGWCGTMFIN